MFLAMLGVLGAMAGCGGDDGPAPARSFRMGPVDRTTEAEALTAAGRSIRSRQRDRPAGIPVRDGAGALG